MRARDGFSSYNPLFLIAFFIFVVLVTMIVRHPVLGAASFTGSLFYLIYLKGKKALLFLLKFVLPVMILTMIINPAFNHRGVTPLFYVNDNPVTLESMIYGLYAAFIFGAVMMWFSAYNEIMTTDKFVYAFGRLLPALSLVLSMALRFIPRFSRHIRTVSSARRCLGMSPEEGSIMRRIRNGAVIFSSTVTWALENSVDTADAMASRGYGTGHRTTYATYRFDRRDAVMSVITAALAILVIVLLWRGNLYMQFYPSIDFNHVTPASVICGTVFVLLCWLPLIIDFQETVTWRYLTSKI